MNLKELFKGEITQQELLNYYNATITYESLERGINGFIKCYKGIYNIFINKNLSYYKRKKTLIHELAHIELNHLEQIDNDLFAFHIDKYEDEADKYVKSIMEDDYYKK